MPELSFVMSPRQNWFFQELVAAIRDELESQGVASSVCIGAFPEARSNRVYVLAPPHEYVALEGIDALPPDELMERTILICAEQPSTVHFDENVKIAVRAGSTFDINLRAVERFRQAGIPARHLQLGYTPRWDHFDSDRERDLDVVFLGSHSPRRSAFLNSYARTLSRWKCHIQISDNSKPNTDRSTSFLTDEKWDLLSRAKILINIHQGKEPYFEWMRALDAVHCGAVLVSEHSTGMAPFVPREHLLTGRPQSLAQIADNLLRDPAALDRMRRGAHQFIRNSMPFAVAVAELAGAARVLVTRPLVQYSPVVKPQAMPADPEPTVRQPPQSELSLLRGGLKGVRLELLAMRRQLARIEEIGRSPGGEAPPLVERVYETRSWRARRGATVTVVTALYNHPDTIAAALDSVVAGNYDDIELVVVDDGSGDRSGRVALEWMKAHEDVSAVLARHPVNRGLGAARNTATDFGRGRYCFVLDSDNRVYPRCLAELVSTLDADREAAFAYPILEAFGMVEAYLAIGGDSLVSFFGWDPDRLRNGNYIDALALIRTDALRRVGGYTTDRRLYGWEDYDLWCGIAEDGLRGRLVPQILAQYQVSPTSMRSTTDLSDTDAMTALIERHPKLMAGKTPPL